MRAALPLNGACVVLRDGSMPASYGSVREMGIRLPIGAAGEVMVAPERELTTTNSISSVRRPTSSPRRSPACAARSGCATKPSTMR